MSAPSSLPVVPAADAQWWRVPIEMPVHDSGKHRGEPVGWVSLNNIRVGAKGQIANWRAAKAWKAATYKALERYRVTTGLQRIYLQVEFRFQDGRKRDLPNLELTIKAIVDVLRPMRRYHRKRKNGSMELVVELGRGIIPDDDQRYLVRGPEMPVGEPLGTKNPVKGMVILYIAPLPPLEGTAS